ncbi:ATP-binding protein, partial [Oharaeibacter diazotrophicus]
RAVTTPLRRLAAAVEAAAPDGLPGAIPVDGPAEVRAVASAIAANTDRIRALMADNARTLAAVGHDLRTPLTRLRLRVDFVEDDDVRAALVGDLDYMTALTEEALAHLRGSGRPEPLERVDVGSLLSTVVDRFADLDADVRADLPAGLEAPLRPNAVQRAVRNLIENALRHAGHARVSARRAGRHVVIAVADEGPGIAPEDRDRLVRPFERGDAARTSGPDHGLGLGLSIARDVAVSHGGRLVLGDNVPTGLIATLELPADAAAG